jgi:hypothetical protein
MTKEECSKLKIGTLIVSEISGSIAVVDAVEITPYFAPKDWAIRTGKDQWLKYQAWRKMTSREIKALTQKALNVLDE